MNFAGIYSLYQDDPPYTWEYKDTSRGEDDFRRTVFAQWEDQGLAIKIACNDFTTPHRVEIWRKTAAAYKAMGYYCPQIIDNRYGNAAETVDYEGRPCIVYAEELAQLPTKAATLLVVPGDGTSVDAATVEAIDQSASGVAFDKTGLKTAPTEGKYKVMLGYYDKEGTFKKATSNLFGSDIMIGDATLNGKVNVDDATAIIKHSAKIKLLEGEALEAADANGNGKVNVDDATCVIKYAAKMTTGIGNIGQ